ncbi:response regulator [Nocardioides aurantiacus]|uniref:LuxR family two component transcriptional regulator n=1 Tax=Nocardioides aurantiacus TaxID=86796 RepID=A0A3N2CS44_9ACTN|nr:response regulator transcription factor [Nocardioides aurantiacus]ROR90246.1 LuxR family two component transcriptional regulator [Nocardioides aurantiacus]
MDRVLVIDDHRVVAELLADAIQAQPDFEAVGCARGVEDGLRLVEDLAPDIVVMDVRLEDGDGLAATYELTEQQPDLRVVILSANIDEGLLRRAADANACAVLPKDGDLHSVLDALRTAARGSFVVHPRLLRQLERSSDDRTAGPPTLTQRELEVLRHLSTGMGATQIARELGVSVHTCRGHVKSLLAKLDAHSQLEAVAKAVRLGLIHVFAET